MSKESNSNHISIEAVEIQNHVGAKKAFVFKGALTFDTVNSVWKRREEFLSTELQIVFDLRGVEHTDSAGLALLIAILGEANLREKRLYFVNIPKQLIDIASVSGVESILPIH